MCDFHNFGLIFTGQCTVCLPQRQKKLILAFEVNVQPPKIHFWHFQVRPKSWKSHIVQRCEVEQQQCKVDRRQKIQGLLCNITPFCDINTNFTIKFFFSKKMFLMILKGILQTCSGNNMNLGKEKISVIERTY